MPPVDQFHTPTSFTISDSNLSDFSAAAVFVHPDSVNPLVLDLTDETLGTQTGPLTLARGSLLGEPVYLYMYNDTVSNSNQGVHINGDTSDDTSSPSVYQASIQNVTFYNDRNGIQTEGPNYDLKNNNSGVEVLGMNDIFDGSANDGTANDGTGIAVDLVGNEEDSQLQYNIFYDNYLNVQVTPPPGLITNADTFQGNQGGRSTPTPISSGLSVPVSTPRCRTTSSSRTHPRSTRGVAKSGHRSR